MGFVNDVPIPSSHNCQLPSLSGHGFGTYWLCEDCGRLWVVSGKNGAYPGIPAWNCQYRNGPFFASLSEAKKFLDDQNKTYDRVKAAFMIIFIGIPIVIATLAAFLSK